MSLYSTWQQPWIYNLRKIGHDHDDDDADDDDEEKTLMPMSLSELRSKKRILIYRLICLDLLLSLFLLGVGILSPCSEAEQRGIGRVHTTLPSTLAIFLLALNLVFWMLNVLFALCPILPITLAPLPSLEPSFGHTLEMWTWEYCPYLLLPSDLIFALNFMTYLLLIGLISS